MTKLAYPINRTILFDAPDSNTYYIGEAPFGAATTDPIWRIKRLVFSGANFTLDWADGNDEFNKIWDNRTLFTYG